MYIHFIFSELTRFWNELAENSSFWEAFRYVFLLNCFFETCQGEEDEDEEEGEDEDGDEEDAEGDDEVDMDDDDDEDGDDVTIFHFLIDFDEFATFFTSKLHFFHLNCTHMNVSKFTNQDEDDFSDDEDDEEDEDDDDDDVTIFTFSLFTISTNVF